MHAPLFWKEKTRLSTALLPASALYRWAARRRAAATPQQVSVPVICIGNVIAGGSGKTPVALALGALLKARGKQAQYLSRGYKGRLRGPVAVDPECHTAAEVGDEPLLLARMFPTWVAKNRAEGAKAAFAAGAECILMDDGFQNATLHKDVSLLVIDGEYGFGNSRILPAGPLREPVAEAMQRASAVILLGEDRHRIVEQVPAHLPVFRGEIVPEPAAAELQGKPVVAFAGIARPRKFHRTLRRLGCTVKKMVAFPDHHAFSARDLARLRARAKEYDAVLVTTTKDFVRLPQAMRAEVRTVAVEAVFADPDALLRIVLP